MTVKGFGTPPESAVVEVGVLPTPLLTHGQARAMRSFLWRPGRHGYDDQSFDGSVWDWGVRPWPTMDNLVTKGYVTRVRWWDEDTGYEYLLTDLGREYMTWLVATETAKQSTPKVGS